VIIVVALAAAAGNCGLIGRRVAFEQISLGEGAVVYFQSPEMANEGVVFLTQREEPCGKPDPESDYRFRQDAGPHLSYLVRDGTLVVLATEEHTVPKHPWSIRIDIMVLDVLDRIKFLASEEARDIKIFPASRARFTCYW
jgi:hypothetical protein